MEKCSMKTPSSRHPAQGHRQVASVASVWTPSHMASVNCRFPSVCQERPSKANANVDTSASPSVAQLAGRFREQAATAKEVSQAASRPCFGEGGRGPRGRGSSGQAGGEGGRKLGHYQIRKRSHRGVPLRVRNVTAAGPGPAPALLTESGAHRPPVHQSHVSASSVTPFPR